VVRRSFTAVLERNLDLTGQVETEPYETGWATEARFFVRVLDSPCPNIRLRVQISPDGLIWCNERPEPYMTDGATLFSLAVREFGHWLRLHCETVQPGVQTKIMIYLALKE
jgi:hypothetical protein